MRYTPTENNLVIQYVASELTPLINGVVSLLVPKYTQKVYILAEPMSLYSLSLKNVVVVTRGNEPSNFLRSFRLILREEEIVVVPSHSHHVSQSEWRAFAKELLAYM